MTAFRLILIICFAGGGVNQIIPVAPRAHQPLNAGRLNALFTGLLGLTQPHQASSSSNLGPVCARWSGVDRLRFILDVWALGNIVLNDVKAVSPA